MAALGLIPFCIIIPSAFLLRIEDADEGSCAGTRFQSVPIDDPSFADSFKYVPAISRLNLYAVSSGHPRFSEMSDFELVNNICLSHNMPLSKSFTTGAAFGFGDRVLANYTVYHSRDQPGVYYTQSTVNSNDGGGAGIMGGGSRTITLTDYSTFVFFAHCWFTSSEHKGWEVFSLTPKLSESTKRMTVEHAVSLGFNREQIVFLNYDSCGIDLGDDDGGSVTGENVTPLKIPQYSNRVFKKVKAADNVSLESGWRR